MLRIPGYRVDGLLLDDRHTLIYQGRREDDARPVLIKSVREARAPALTHARLRRELELAPALPSVGMVHALALVPEERGEALILEGVEGDFLRNRLQAGPIGVAPALELAGQIMRVLAALHQSGILHRGLRPEHILVAADGSQSWLTGFERATGNAAGDISAADPLDDDASMLPYLSPEETGRMDRQVDYRSDYYSLGVVLYEMLTGHLPFVADDPLELIHAHIARVPSPPAERDPAVPRGVSDLVMKLLAKSPEDRYQSAAGLQFDLTECLTRWGAHADVEPFPLARRDLPERLEIPERLYGRDDELEQLLSAFQRVREGATELLLVAGAAGVGKTALVRETSAAILARGGYFVGGKYDQLERSTLRRPDPGLSGPDAPDPDRGRGEDCDLEGPSFGGPRPQRAGHHRDDPGARLAHGQATSRARPSTDGDAEPVQPLFPEIHLGLCTHGAAADPIPG